jgi:hypothetical protein
MVDMRTLYLRNVPDDVAAELEDQASARGMSLNAYLVARLSAISGQRRNAELLGALPDLGIPAEVIVDAIRALRESRDP